jgi:SAM-dependent methyltransferase
LEGETAVPGEDGGMREGSLRCPTCVRSYPVRAGVPRLLPGGQSAVSAKTQALFGDEWTRFPTIEAAHDRIFAWYFEGPTAIEWPRKTVLDAGCGMGRWLHFARRAGADIVGLDLSPAIDVAARREGEDAALVQGDLTQPPFAPASFDLVYSLGVVHHLEDPARAVRVLADLVRPGGELRLYVYRSLEDEPWARRTLLSAVTFLRRGTVRLPPRGLHAFSWTVAAVATALFLAPHRVGRHLPGIGRWTAQLPLTQYTDVPFRMLVAEQFDRFGAPLEGRFRREDVEGWLHGAQLDVVAILPELGWRAIAKKPLSA